ncbi:MAG: M14 family metallopeptidase [bacterium]
MRLHLPGAGRRGRSAGAVLALLFLLGAASDASAQKVPISFDDYHGYTGTVDYLQKVARAYPDLTELIPIGESTMGRTIYVLVVSDMETGTTIDQHVELRNLRKEGVRHMSPMESYQGKPGHWIDGGTHGNEYTGTEVCLYIIDKLLTGYGEGGEIEQLVDDNTFYICPIVNPDGVFNSVERGISQRQNSMEVDDDEDGEVNEDGPDDLNGDGHITSFRYPDPEGRYVIDDVDPRIMVRLGREESTEKQRYSVIREDRDNDGDGRRGEDSERGIDVNRNYPEGWFDDQDRQAGTGDYPSSAPESRAILEFFTNHTNILLAQSFHTSGGFTYRPFARWPDSRIAPKDLVIYDRVMGRYYTELLGQELPDAWKEPITSGQEGAGATRGTPRSGRRSPQRSTSRDYELPRAWRHPYNDDAGRPYGFGIFIDWAYAQFGAWAMTTELWNWREDHVGAPAFEGEDARLQYERWYLDHQDSEAGGRFFVPWERYRHPELGEGEIGGWISTYFGGNVPPGESLVALADRHWQFELFKARMLPRLAITDASAEVIYTTDSAREAEAVARGDGFSIRPAGRTGTFKVVKVTARVENSGQLDTHLENGARLDGNREDVIWLLGPRDRIRYLQGTAFIQLGTLEGTLQVPGSDPPATSREVTWLVAVEGDGPLELVLSSQKGGTVVREITLR